jgi:hypothetical protein
MECVSDFQDIQDRNIAFATFNFAHMRAVNLSGICQRLLRQSCSFAMLTNSFAQQAKPARFISMARDPIHGRIVMFPLF